MCRTSVALLLVFAGAGCATPLHLRPVPLSADGRTLQNLFLGGWDGHRLDLYNDTSLEPGVTRIEEAAKALTHLSSQDYAVIYVDKSKLSAEEANAHGLFCDAPVCIAILERHSGDDFHSWGGAVAVFEFTGPHADVAGSVWLDGRYVREPGPQAWPLVCRSPTDQPHHVHQDGGAWFPARSGPTGNAFAQFGPNDTTAEYKRSGFVAPDAKTCVFPEVAPPPAIRIDTTPQAGSTGDKSSDSSGRKKKRHRDNE